MGTGIKQPKGVGTDSVGEKELKEPAVDTAYLSDSAVTSAKMGVDSVGRRELTEPAVDTAYLFDNSVTSAKSWYFRRF